MVIKKSVGTHSNFKGAQKQSGIIANGRDGSQSKIDLFSIGILNSLSAHIAVIDFEGNIIAVNEAWKQFAAENCGGENDVNVGSNYFTVCRQAVNEDDQDALHALNGIKQVLDDKLTEFEYEYACHSEDEKRWFLMRVTPMLFRGKKAVVAHINITDKKLAEMSLIEREQELSSLNIIGRAISSYISLEEVVNAALEQIVEIIKPNLAMLFLKDGEKLNLEGIGPKSQASKYKISHAHKVGQCLCGLSVSNEESIFSTDIHSDARCNWQECKKAGFTSFAAIPLLHRDEIIGTLGIASVAERDFEKRRQFLEAIASDFAICIDNSILYEKVKKYAQDLESELAHRKKMEKISIQTQKMEALGTLAGGIAHDFNNILSAVYGYTELALEDANHGTLQYENLREVLKAGNRAKDLVQQILTFSRKVEMESQPFQVSLILKEALKLLRASIPSTIEIDQKIQSDAYATGNSSQIHQIILNLCANATHAMEEKGGVITVRLSDVEFDSESVTYHPEINPGQYIILSVSDTGTGMPPDVMKKIYDPFFTTKGKGIGTGMGLSVVHGIVNNHGGAIYAYSEPGKGSTFKVLLPAIKGPMKSEGRLEKSIPTGTESILFIDDEPAIVKMGKQILESLGYNVVTRTSSIEALELFKSQKDKFDLVVTDMTMPHMTGEILAKELFRIRPDIPVILCTGFSAMIDEKKALALGIRAFIAKPVLKRDIAEAIRSALDGK